MAKKEYYYCIVEDDDPGAEGLAPDYTFKSEWDSKRPEYVAKEAAEDYHENHDGWEADWPVKIALFDSDKSFIGKYEIELFHQPFFSAEAIE